MGEYHCLQLPRRSEEYQEGTAAGEGERNVGEFETTFCICTPPSGNEGGKYKGAATSDNRDCSDEVQIIGGPQGVQRGK